MAGWDSSGFFDCIRQVQRTSLRMTSGLGDLIVALAVEPAVEAGVAQVEAERGVA